MTDDEKKEVLATFQKEFDVFNLTKEILERIEQPAELNRIYEAEVVQFERKRSANGKPIAIVKMKTQDKKVMDCVLNDEFTSDQVREFLCKLGATTPEKAIGKKANVFYSNRYPALQIV